MDILKGKEGVTVTLLSGATVTGTIATAELTAVGGYVLMTAITNVVGMAAAAELVLNWNAVTAVSIPVIGDAAADLVNG